VKSRKSSTPDVSWSACADRRPGQVTSPVAAATMAKQLRATSGAM